MGAARERGTRGFGVRDKGPWVARSSRAGSPRTGFWECGMRGLRGVGVSGNRLHRCEARERVTRGLGGVGFRSAGTAAGVARSSRAGLRGPRLRECGDGPRRCGARERGKAGASEPQGFRGGFGMWDADLREQASATRGLGGTGPGRWGAGLRGVGPEAQGFGAWDVGPQRHSRASKRETRDFRPRVSSACRAGGRGAEEARAQGTRRGAASLEGLQGGGGGREQGLDRTAMRGCREQRGRVGL